MVHTTVHLYLIQIVDGFWFLLFQARFICLHLQISMSRMIGFYARALYVSMLVSLCFYTLVLKFKFL